MSVEKEIAAIRERRVKITVGQWHQRDPNVKSGENIVIDSDSGRKGSRGQSLLGAVATIVNFANFMSFDEGHKRCDAQMRRNAEFIAKAPNDIDFLLSLVTTASPAPPAQVCVKCGHRDSRDAEGFCQQPFPIYQLTAEDTMPCSCKCEFPAPPEEGESEQQNTSVDEEKNDPVNHHGMADEASDLVSGMVAALRAVQSATSCPFCPNWGYYTKGPTDAPEMEQCEWCWTTETSMFHARVKVDVALTRAPVCDTQLNQESGRGIVLCEKCGFCQPVIGQKLCYACANQEQNSSEDAGPSMDAVDGSKDNLVANAWLPISSAPREADIYRVVARFRDSEMLWWERARWNTRYSEWRTHGGVCEPTHHLPLPAQPQKEGK